MQRATSSVILTLFLLLLPTPSQAQTWTPAQQEVWAAEVACLNAGIDDLPARKACLHPDFKGWGVQEPVPSSFKDREFDYFFSHQALKVVKAEPLHILVEGDLAVIQLMVFTVSSWDGEPDVERWVAWTDVMRRDDGVWRWIADHGHALDNSN